ncbi:MAG: hypothetical protein K1X94_32325 [Sandaracinaceae bacterium]|nr:hypothetical protein [Sandaracinaceae bacterium]
MTKPRNDDGSAHLVGRPRDRERAVPRRIASVSMVLAATALGCGDPPPSTASRVPVVPQPVVAVAAPRPVASSIAFDLVATPGGAVLAWGRPSRQGGGIRALAVDPLGSPRGTEVDVVHQGEARSGSADEAPAQIEELTIASSGTRVGLTWVVSTPSPVVQATFSPQEVEGFAPPHTLAPTVALVPGTRAARGRIAISSREDGALVVTHRVTDAPCSAGVAAEVGTAGAVCARVARSEVDSLVAQMEPSIEMEVPGPCPSLLAGAVTTAGTWFYGVCHQTPTQATTLYAIRPSISWASANDMLPECLPEAIAPLPEGAALIGRCGEALRMSVLDAMGRETSVVNAPHLEVSCEAGRPSIVVAGEATPRRVPLLAAVSRLEGLLPERIAPRGSRAVWTGTSLLVAAPLEGEVALRRYECRELGLVRTDLP